MGEFNLDNHYIYYCGQESLRKNGVSIIVNKRVRNAVLGCSPPNDSTISVHFQSKPFNIRVIQVYAPATNAEEAKLEPFYEDIEDLLGLTPRKDVPFIIGNQEIPGITGKFDLGVQSEAGQRPTEFCQQNVLVMSNTPFQQHNRKLHMDITRWSTPKSHWFYSLQPKMEKLYTISRNETGSWLWLISDHELLMQNPDLNWRK